MEGKSSGANDPPFEQIEKKNLLSILQTFITVFDRVVAQPPTAVNFLRKTCPWIPIDFLCLRRSKTPYPLIEPRSKNPGNVYV